MFTWVNWTTLFDSTSCSKQLRNILKHTACSTIPVAALATRKVSVCDRSLVGIAGSNPTGGMEVCLLWVLCVVRYRSLGLADHSSRGAPPSVLCLSVILKPQQWWCLGPLGLSSHEGDTVGSFSHASYSWIAKSGKITLTRKKRAHLKDRIKDGYRRKSENIVIYIHIRIKKSWGTELFHSNWFTQHKMTSKNVLEIGCGHFFDVKER